MVGNPGYMLGVEEKAELEALLPYAEPGQHRLISAVIEHGGQRAAARALGDTSNGNISRAIKVVRDRAIKQGAHLSEGARQAVQEAGLSGNEGKLGWIVNVDPETGSRKSTFWRAQMPEEGEQDALERIREAFDDLSPSIPVEPPEHVETDSLAFLPHADVHVGMRATDDQTGGRGYDRRAAEQRFRAGVSKCVFGTDPCHTALIVNMGDMMHSNDDTDLTPRSKHKLKTEGTHAENLLLSVQLTVYKIDLALQRHQNVVYRGIPGNHDPNIPAPITIALQAHYRNEPRVKVVLSENEFWQENWGNVFLSGHHGHGRKAKEVCPVLPGKFPKAWGRATEWHFFTAHLHNYSTEIIGSVRHHQLPAVCSIDTHAAWSPYLDTSGMIAMTFSKRGGYVPSIQVGV